MLENKGIKIPHLKKDSILQDIKTHSLWGYINEFLKYQMQNHCKSVPQCKEASFWVGKQTTLGSIFKQSDYFQNDSAKFFFN